MSSFFYLDVFLFLLFWLGFFDVFGFYYKVFFVFYRISYNRCLMFLVLVLFVMYVKVIEVVFVGCEFYNFVG